MSDDDSFDAGFDPALEVDKALVMILWDGRRVRIAELPEVDKPSLQKQFESGWLGGLNRSTDQQGIVRYRLFCGPQHSAHSH